MTIDIRLPHLGENIEAGQVVKVLVKPGDHVNKNQNVLELETDKASIEIPVDVAGVIKKIHVKEGETIAVDNVFLTLDEVANIQLPTEKNDASTEKTHELNQMEYDGDSGERFDPSPTVKSAPKPSNDSAYKVSSTQSKEHSTIPKAKAMVPASPSTRRFAREIGIDITQVPSSGPGGRISVEDVKAYSKELNRRLKAGGSSLTAIKSLPNFTQWGEIRVESFSNIRAKTAENLSYAWSAIPHVTQFDKADITGLEQQRKDFAHLAESANAKLTITAIILKVLAAALKNFPRFNSSIDLANRTIIFKDYYHIGVAVDTDRGLIVPVIRDVDQKSIIELCVELASAADRARKKKTSIEEMQGGTFTISNLGGIGGTSFTPIVKWPEVGILGIARSTMEAVYLNGEFTPRLMLPLSLSYDHRIIDGADGARFLRWIVTALENPLVIALDN